MPATPKREGTAPGRRARWSGPAGCRPGRRPRPPRSARPNSGWETGPAHPPALRRTRRNSRRLSALAQLKSARQRYGFVAASRARPAACSRNGRTSSRKVTKLDTGLPGRPMKWQALHPPAPASAHPPKANGLPGLMAICQRSSEPSGLHGGLDVVFLAHRHAAAGEDQVVVLGGARAAPPRWRRAGRARCPGRSPRSPGGCSSARRKKRLEL